MGLFDFFKKKTNDVQEQKVLDRGLEKTKEGLFSKITKAVIGRSVINDEVLDELEEIRFTARNETEAADEFLKKGGLKPKDLGDKLKDYDGAMKFIKL